ncbi:hypothetical protein HDV05_005753 [Chytridiales sp. JEL 0842]|nr:hypothetical protein HDV05_005753 [Chytridiales sp. JEL 0842]
MISSNFNCQNVDGRGLLANFERRVVLHRQNFNEPVRDIQFSPNGKFVAVTHGRKLQIWRTPGFEVEFAPFVLHREIAGPYDDIVTLQWSPDSQYILAGCKDMTVRVFSTDPIEGFQPTILSGHKDVICGAWFSVDAQTIYSVSRDGSLLTWKYKTLSSVTGFEKEDDDDDEDDRPRDSKLSANTRRKRQRKTDEETGEELKKWLLIERNYFKQNHAKVVSAAFHAKSNLLVVGFNSGVFGIWELPDFTNIHVLSISQKKVDTVAINPSGDWLAFGCSKLGQLLVWEWQSESYVLKQQGHQHDMTSISYSKDGQYIVTGGDDGKLKLWNTQTGFCFVTFTDHSAGIQAVEFSPKGQVVFSASLDGTVRAFDMVRYRNFRTFTTPTPVQFSCLAVDPSGEVVCAGSVDTFEIFVWSVQTGKLLDILSGHKGPISSLVFSPTEGQLVSGSWDKSIRTWDVFNRDLNTESFEHGTEVLAVAYRPDGRQVAVSTLDGQITLWDVDMGRQVGVIDGRRDIAGGRKSTDRRTAENNLSGKNFESLCYTVDGSCIIAGGNSKWVCIYDITSAILLKKFQISHNLSLDGMHEKLDSRNMTEAGPRDLIDETGELSDLEDRIDKSLPGAQKGDLSVRNTKLEARTTCVRFSPTGRTWSAASTEGLLVYSLDETIMFDPFDLEIDITPQSIMEVLEEQKDYLRALVMAFRLGERQFTEKVLDTVPTSEISLTAKNLPAKYLERLLVLLADRMEGSQKLHFNLLWSIAALRAHGQFLKDRSQEYSGVIRALIKGINRAYAVLSKVTNENIGTVKYLTKQMELAQKMNDVEESMKSIDVNDVSLEDLGL